MAVDVRPAVIGQDVYRRLAGQPATAQRIATDVPSGGTYQDYTAVSGVSYEYQVIAFGSNGTQQASAWTS
jgi:hypothetical protein